MRYLLTCLLIGVLYSAPVYSYKISEVLPQLSYARYCADTIHDCQRALKAYNEIINLFSKAQDDSLRLVAETERIELLYRTGKSPRVLQAVPKAVELAKRLDEAEKLSMLLGIKGEIYARSGFSAAARRIINQANDYAAKIKDETSKNLHLGRMTALRTLLTESTEEKIFYFKQAARYLRQISRESSHFSQAQHTALICRAAVFIHRGKSDSALHYLKQAIASDIEYHTFPDFYFAVSNYAALQHTLSGYKQSETVLRAALQKAQRNENIYIQEKLLYQLYLNANAQGNTPAANQYLSRYAGLHVQIRKVSRERIEIIESELNKTRDELISQASREKTPIVLFLSGTTVLLTLTLGGLYLKKRTASTPLVIQPRELPEETGRVVSAEEIHELIALAKQDDPSFLHRFQEYYPTFTARINAMANPPLNNIEMEICACTKLHFSTKDIALYRNYTVRSVENRKYRIRKKLMLNSEVDFVVWVAGVK